jgi:predicted peptidase
MQSSFGIEKGIRFASIVFCMFFGFNSIISFSQMGGFQQMQFPQRGGGFQTPTDSRVKTKSYQFDEKNKKMQYALFVSSKVKKQDKSPLIVMLHGLGAPATAFMRGNMLDLAQKGGYIVVGPMGYSLQGAFGAPIDPKSPGGHSKIDELCEKDTMNVLDIVRKEYSVDENRTYLLGFSAGGAGSIYLGVKYASNWTAVAAVAPAGFFLQPSMLEPVKDTLPFIVVQGDSDTIVPVGHSRRWVQAMEEMKMNYKYIELQGGTHINVLAASMPRIFEFFNEHSKSDLQK